MLNLTATDKKKLEAASARGEGLEVVELVPGLDIYQVTSNTSGRTYTVVFTWIAGQLFGDCNCQAGQKGRDCCKHLAAAGKLMKEEKKAVKAATAPALVGHELPGRAAFEFEIANKKNYEAWLRSDGVTAWVNVWQLKDNDAAGKNYPVGDFTDYDLRDALAALAAWKKGLAA